MLAAAAIVFAYNALLVATAPSFTPWADDGLRNRMVTERYFDRTGPAAVIVGSSISARVAPDILRSDDLGPSVYNLSLQGEGAATGIEVILRKPQLPRLVIVELTYGYRPASAALLRQMEAEPHRTLRQYLPAFRLEGRPVDFLMSLLLKMRPPLTTATSADGVEAEPEEMTSRLRYWIAQNSVSSETHRLEIEAGFGRLGEAIDQLRARNVRVALLWFPMHPELAATPLERLARQYVAVRFPSDRYEWLDIPNPENYRTVDGMHPTRPSARRIALLLRNFAEGSLSR
jgi:hypothetical protein